MNLLVGLLLVQIPFLKCTSILKDTYVNQNERESKKFDVYHEPSTEYEKLRRRIKKNVFDFWHIFSQELDEIQNSAGNFTPKLAFRFANVVKSAKEYHRAMVFDCKGLQMADGYSTWRKREAADLGGLMQRRLYHLQNPKDCNLARVAILSFRGTGFGSQLHALVHSFILSYATNRTMIVDSRKWWYNEEGWNLMFSPLSDACPDFNKSFPSETNTTHVWFPSENQILYLGVYPLNPVSPFFPPTLPTDLAPRLKRLHGNPFAWWVGQFLKYILRPGNQMGKMAKEIDKRLLYKRPYVGVHIRRTDKSTEVAYDFFSIEKFMDEVEEYYKVLELSEDVPVRRIYLATDDPGVIQEIKDEYENRYQIFSNSVVAHFASLDSSRYNNESLMGIVLDIFYLSLSDYLVCTFTSNVCRVAYEIMQIFHPDASDKAHSLDERYYYDGELKGSRIAEYPHYGGNRGELHLDLGDEVTDVLEFVSGYSLATSRRLKQVGWYPSFKVQQVWKTHDFPTYPDAR